MNDIEFDSEFCNVKYIKKDNVVLITWKKFCSYDNYRKPTLFGLELLKNNKNSNLIIDARNGFEDEKADVEWGFSVLIPEMSKTDCKKVVFIMQEVNENEIEAEMDMWTREFLKYFKVKKAASYEAAINYIKRRVNEKVYAAVISGRADNNIKFTDFQNLIVDLGFKFDRQRGSHIIYVNKAINEIMNIQSRGSKAKEYQVRDLRNIIFKYNL